MNRLVLIDGNAMMHRAYHALPPMRTADGQPAHVVYGFVSMIIKLFFDVKPTHIAVAFDRPGPTFRQKLYKEYQAQRPSMEDDFVSQIALVHDIVAAFGIPTFEKDGFEADDMIGTIATHVKKPIDQVIIVTGDRDILQLVVDEKVLVFMPTKGLSEGKIYGEKEVIERMGVAPRLIVDLKALMGDSSDNYPGVAGIGPKTATQLLGIYGSLEKVYLDIGKIKPDGVQNKLIAGRESALLGKHLATIRTDAPIVFKATAARIETLDKKEAIGLLETYNFPSLIRRIKGESRESTPIQSVSSEKKKDVKKSLQQQLF